MTTLCWGQHYRGRVARLLPVLRGQPPVLGRLPGQRLRPPLVAAVDLVLGVLGPRAAAQLLRRDERDVAVPDADLRGRSEVRGGRWEVEAEVTFSLGVRDCWGRSLSLMTPVCQRCVPTMGKLLITSSQSN